MTEYELVEAAQKQNAMAQRAIYERYAPAMMGLCIRYVKNREDAEDALVEGFFKAFDKITLYKGDGSFEGWLRRIMVNECLMKLRKNHNFKMTIEFEGIEMHDDYDPHTVMAAEELLSLLEALPTGYRTVFNLYVMEGLKHREIGELLGISINTSKSQLILAKEKMKDLLQKKFGKLANR